ncbi:MAG: hypothetical protein RDU14_16730 [Melioribacteraceae bacterium]|nr:hypothetical protein [Melioribacteraceae bacterium]
MPITIGGKTYNVPGAYGTVEVVNLGSVVLPAFNNLLFVGSARKGLPSTSSATRKSYEFIKSFSSIGDAKDWFGSSDLTRAMEYAKLGGAGVVNLVNIAPLTNGLATIKDNAGSPVNTFDIVPKDKYFGAAGNDISLTIATASSKPTITIIPPKLTKFLTVTAAVDSTWLTLDDVEGLAVNQAIKVWSNASSTAQATTIAEIDTVTNKIRIADLPTAAYATTDYARIFLEDTDKQEVKTFESTATITDVILWINSGSILTASRNSYAGIVPTTLAKIFFQVITSATKGTSPVATETGGGSFDIFAASAGQFFEEFTSYTKVRMRLLGLLSSAAAVHAVYKALAADLRTNIQYSIQVVTGCALGDVLLSATTDPITRAKALNSDDVILAGMGINGKSPHMSLAPLYAGMISANTVLRNFTSDVVSATTVEKFFGESNKATETVNYLTNGVLLVGTGPNGYFIIQGVNTWQNHANVWTEDGAHSYLTMQRQIVDFVYEGYKNQMLEGVGADGYGPAQASLQGMAILDKYLREGFITDRRMVDAWSENNAVKTKPEIVPLDATDFVGFVLVVKIPS